METRSDTVRESLTLGGNSRNSKTPELSAMVIGVNNVVHTYDSALSALQRDFLYRHTWPLSESALFSLFGLFLKQIQALLPGFATFAPLQAYVCSTDRSPAVPILVFAGLQHASLIRMHHIVHTYVYCSFLQRSQALGTRAQSGCPVLPERSQSAGAG